MFNLSKRTHYGILAVMELAEHQGQGLVQLKDIAQRRNIPKDYLLQILNRLGKHGIVRGTRGNQGGFELAEAPEQLTVYRVAEALEGRVSPKGSSALNALQELHNEIEGSIRSILDVSIVELAVRQRKFEHQPMFHI
jgi:Rrf2 family protein